MTPEIEALAAEAGLTWLDHQAEVLEAASGDDRPRPRACLYHRTGAGKSATAMAMVLLWGWTSATVIAPPSTHVSWEEWGRRLGLRVTCMSHAKFRMKGTKLGRNEPVIADEFHMFGGHKGQGWKKLWTLSRHLEAPLILASATPNYNDAERVYCVQSILDPIGTKGGYLEFLYRNCNTEQNPYGQEPLVDELQPFLHHKNAEEFLASLPHVYYLKDELVWSITDVPYLEPAQPTLDEFGYDRRNHRMIASQIEEKHVRRYQGLVHANGVVHAHILTHIMGLLNTNPVLIYCNHSTVAEALAASLGGADLVTGDTSKKKKDYICQRFREGKVKILVGTASLATGTDGFDKVCDRLIIVDDTEDDALRRQLVGRIMPRGEDSDATGKQVYRLVPE